MLWGKPGLRAWHLTHLLILKLHYKHDHFKRIHGYFLHNGKVQQCLFWTEVEVDKRALSFPEFPKMELCSPLPFFRWLIFHDFHSILFLRIHYLVPEVIGGVTCNFKVFAWPLEIYQCLAQCLPQTGCALSVRPFPFMKVATVLMKS